MLSPTIKIVASALMAATMPAVMLGQAQQGHKTVEYHQYTSYFERNDAGRMGPESYLVLTSQTQFDQEFGVAAGMGDNNFLAQDAFEKNIVLAVVRRGPFTATYSIVQVYRQGAQTVLSYTEKDTASPSATFASPLIVLVPRSPASGSGAAKKFVFVKNGKTAGTATSSTASEK